MFKGIKGNRKFYWCTKCQKLHSSVKVYIYNIFRECSYTEGIINSHGEAEDVFNTHGVGDPDFSHALVVLQCPQCSYVLVEEKVDFYIDSVVEIESIQGVMSKLSELTVSIDSNSGKVVYVGKQVPKEKALAELV